MTSTVKRYMNCKSPSEAVFSSCSIFQLQGSSKVKKWPLCCESQVYLFSLTLFYYCSFKYSKTMVERCDYVRRVLTIGFTARHSRNGPLVKNTIMSDRHHTFCCLSVRSIKKNGHKWSLYRTLFFRSLPISPLNVSRR